MNYVQMPAPLSPNDPVLLGSLILLGVGLVVGAGAALVWLLHVLFGMKRAARR